MESNAFAFTTIRQGSEKNFIERTRAEVAIDTFTQLQEHGIECVAVYKDCSPKYLQKLQSLGVILIQETGNGMGNARREALREAVAHADPSSLLFWIEPEKPDMPRYVQKMCRHMVNTRAKLGLFNRTAKSMSTYPSEQSHYYQFCRATARALAGFDIDYAFGPMVIHPDSVESFLKYNGRYGDAWDSILVPRIPFIQRDEVAILEIDFQNDPRMTRIESGNVAMILKRIDQFNNVIPSLINEWSGNINTLD